jgi:hypothetical protein
VTALELARQAQTEWKQLPRAAREHEAALEQELRALIDPLFAKERAQRDEATQLATRHEQESRRILDALAALADGDTAALAHADGRIAALAAEWKALHASVAPPPSQRRNDRHERGGRDGRGEPRRDPRDRAGHRPDPRREVARAGGRDPERAFDQAVARVRSAQQALEQTRRGSRMRELADAADLIAAVEGDGANETLMARWDALALDEADRRRLATRWQEACAASVGPVRAEREREAERWLVAAELDAGLESPASAQASRRELQMQRLAARLQGGDIGARAPLERLFEWIALGPLDPALRAPRRERLERVLQAWLR